MDHFREACDPPTNCARSLAAVHYNLITENQFLGRSLYLAIGGEKMALPDQFFSDASFGSLASASGIVFVVSNALQGALNFNPKWFALVLSEAVAIYGTYLAHSAAVPSDYFISVLNGCLVYCTAVGGTAIASSVREKGRPKGVVGDGANSRRAFTSAWF
jgi:hypothetical protein